MGVKRKSFQGISNIIRFNWHYYLMAFAGIAIGLAVISFYDFPLKSIVLAFIILSVLSIFASLLVSFWIYDLSKLYDLPWLPTIEKGNILNIHAGFDETSELIKWRSPNASLEIGDFFDPSRHTEISIQRARKYQATFVGTLKVNPEKLPFEKEKFDQVIVMLSAHEIRNEVEREKFFEELRRVTKENGEIYLTEHLRDVNNFLAFNLGFFHFYSRKNWLRIIRNTGLILESEVKSTPFISTFKLVKNGNTP